MIGAVPTVLAMDMPMLLRSAGYSREAGLGVALGGIMNIVLDPLFMFVLLPKGCEVLGAGVATMLANVISALYFVAVYRSVREKTVLELPKRLEKISSEQKKSLYSVGIPAAFAIVTLDADMIPKSDFLMKTIPYFADAESRDPAHPLGLLQTPQCFYQPDVFQYAIYSEKRAPNEQDFFYRSTVSRSIWTRETVSALAHAWQSWSKTTATERS